MAQSSGPRLRAVETFPVNGSAGETLFALRDPEGFAGSIVIPHAAAILAALMDGERTLTDIQQEFQQRCGQPLALEDLEGLVQQLDERYFLDNERFRQRWKREVEAYLNNPVRPAAHAGGAYAGEPEALLKQLDALFLPPDGPGPPGEPGSAVEGARQRGGARLTGVLSPHIDLYRGGPAFAHAYKRLVEESDADLFVIFGTAHSWMRHLFSVTRKHFDTPLGTVETDVDFIKRLAAKAKATAGGEELDLFGSELAQRNEHSIEFQVLFLQYLLGGRRPFKVVPILTGSFHEFVAAGRKPSESPVVRAFVAGLRATASEHKGKICYISGGDLAHIGRRFGDRSLLDADRLKLQSESDLALLAAACRADSAQFFNQVAGEKDQNRICGLSPTYTMLEVMQPRRGELLRYGQAVEPDGTSCVSFGSLAFYGDS
jgi:MEMO1 family protein